MDPDNEQADQKLQMSREERLDMFIATFKDQSLFHRDDHVDLSGPHEMTMREFASMRLDDIEHGVCTFLLLNICMLSMLFEYMIFLAS